MSFAALASVLAGTGSLIGGAVDAYTGVKDYELNKKVADQNYEQQQQNYELQKEAFDLSKENFEWQKGNVNYEKRLQQQIFSREDTATQRRVADLTAAGLSPTLAAGSAANAGQAIKISSPTAPDAPSSVPQHQGYGKSPKLTQVMAAYQELLRMKADITRTESENSLINAQIGKTEADRIRALSAAHKDQLDAGIKKHDLEIYKDSGMPSNASEGGRTFRDIVGGSKGGVFEDAKSSIGQKFKWINDTIKKNKEREDYEYQLQLKEREQKLRNKRNWRP